MRKEGGEYPQEGSKKKNLENGANRRNMLELSGQGKKDIG